jgi:hypothetical protein
VREDADRIDVAVSDQEVAHVEERRGGPRLGKREPDGDRCDLGEHHRDQERRGEAQDPSRPEAREVDVPVLLPLLDQERGDEEAAQREEEVDAHEAAAQEPAVVGEDAEDGDAAQAVQRAQVDQAPPSDRANPVARHSVTFVARRPLR